VALILVEFSLGVGIFAIIAQFEIKKENEFLIAKHFMYHLKFSHVSFEGQAKQGNSSPASLIKAINFLVVCSSSPKSSMRFLNLATSPRHPFFSDYSD